MPKKNREKKKLKHTEKLNELDQLAIELDNVQDSTEIAIGDGPIEDWSDNFIDNIPVNTPAQFDANHFNDAEFFHGDVDPEIVALASGQHHQQPEPTQPVEEAYPRMTAEYLAQASLEFSRRSVEAQERIAELLENNLILLHQVHAAMHDLALVARR